MRESDESQAEAVEASASGPGTAGYRRFYHHAPVPTLTLDLKARAILDCNAAAVLETHSSIEELPVPVARVRRAVVNLVSNSIKFRRSDQPLVVSVDVTALCDAASITVTDNGPGLGPDPESLFVDGVRGESSHGTAGTGRGLTYARHGVGSLGGTITASPAARKSLPRRPRMSVDPSEGDALRADVLLRGRDEVSSISLVRTAGGEVLVEVAMAAVLDTTLSIVQLHPLPDPPT